MASSNPYEIVDDGDEGFDWEAAAREIDVVCQMTTDANAANENDANANANDANAKAKGKEKVSVKGKQYTLDKFVAIAKKEIPAPQFQEEDTEDPTCIHHIDTEAAKTWIYPVNVPLRDYQFHITQSALFQNTLVALPTGLGKTLIAAVVMYNYFRWFPQGKIVFAAPSRPLVTQQIEACHNIVGIPQEWTVDMTGQLSPPKRARLWKTKRVFFVTPQVLEKDIHSGKCLVKYLVCLVIDEAHRAMGNYSYCEAVRELMAVPVQLRILALTATPGSKQQTVQDVIDNLHISKLEHRSETDHDVVSYVHNRKIELIQVSMGQDAEEINKKFLEVIRPIVARLTNIGVIQNRDYRTLSPCVLLEIREKFRQRNVQDPSHINFVDVEGYFGVLITLYYIHKLLSSHGIRPAYEMLERKLKQGFFAKFMSKNEDILKARQLMQQSLSHGAPSPKLSKMVEVLMEHFKTNDPQNSRVIIFSNYRESVRDIMDALGGTGDLVRATQFIGQSSGKAMKGQSQKVQQAVLKKFRSGAYNVIVATSIGEEGLDIMEVDLVISFDANISPLRMIQRMGRTGRKHDGRVVVLACEGSELKGYLKKKAKSKTISKHMRNGGVNSFVFHPSPRMIPHVLKPEVQYVQLSIEKFVPRQNNVKDDHLQISASKDKLTLAEIDLLEKYFHSTGENKRRLSLIAFPHFQTFPSSVHKVKHSCGTLMLIEMMRRLQGLAAFLGDSKTSLQEGRCLENSKPFVTTELDEAKKDKESCSRDTMGRNLESVNCLQLDSCHLGIQTKDFVDLTLQDNTFCDMDKHQGETCEGDETIPESPMARRNVSNEGANAGEIESLVEIETSLLAADGCINGMRDEELSPRLTNLIKSGVVPESPIDERGQSRNKFVIRDCISPVHLQEKQDVGSLSCKETEKVIIDSGTGNVVPESPIDERGQSRNKFVIRDCISPAHLQEKQDVGSLSCKETEKVIVDSGTGNVVPESPIDERGQSRNKFVIRDCVSPAHLQEKQDVGSLSCKETEKVIVDSGTGNVVPESPIDERGQSRNNFVFRDCVSPVHLLEKQDVGSLSCKETEKVIIDSGTGNVVPESPVDERGQSRNKFVFRDCVSPVHLQEKQDVGSLSCKETEKVIIDSGTGKNVCTSPVNEAQTTLLEMKNCAIRRGHVFLSQIEEGHTHIANPSFSEESHPGCGEMSVSIKPARKLKRLRKIEDTESIVNQKNNNVSDSTANFLKSSSASIPTRYKHGQGKRKPTHNVRDFIEEEAEVSSDACVSNDEVDEEDNSLDSFIDDRANLTAASQPEASRMDMMAIYRRSLLSQTPFNGGLNFAATFSPDNVTMTASIGESGDSSGKTVSHFPTGPTSQSANRTSESVHIDQITSEAVPSTSSPTGTRTEVRSRKRRLAFRHSGQFPSMNLEQEFALQSKKESVDANATIDVLCDDQFYNDIDLDELEAQATSILKRKLDLSTQKQDTNPQSHSPNLDVIMSPSFDLGI